MSENREDLIDFIWDAYKEMNGMRPSWMKFVDMSTDELIKLADDLSSQLQEAFNQDQKARNELAIARSDPSYFVFLTRYGEMLQEAGEELDPYDPEVWSWYKQEAAPKVSFNEVWV